MSRSPPLRFLVLLLAGWTGLRAAWLAPGWWSEPAEADATPPAPERRPEVASPRTAKPLEPPPRRHFQHPAPVGRPGRAGRAPAAFAERVGAEPAGPPWRILPWKLGQHASAERRPAVSAGRGAGPTAAKAAAPRWSFSAWSLLRQGDGPTLVPGGTLGASQAGARALFRLNDDSSRPLAVAIRLSSPVRRPAGAEAALGVDWRPSRRLPLHLLAERRQGLGREARSAFGLTLHGGVSDAPLAGLRIDAYAQAGIVGARSRDLFGDGAVRLSLPIGRFRAGAGAWAAAQPGLARLDLGPQASLRLPLAGRDVMLAVDWRRRVAGGARPGSGPALTMATDF
ncbi:MAG TPA: hypothetical protein VF718_12345 [Allosphingosinicella sp.]|jgi:hypothetical protein